MAMMGTPVSEVQSTVPPAKQAKAPLSNPTGSIVATAYRTCLGDFCTAYLELGAPAMPDGMSKGLFGCVTVPVEWFSVAQKKVKRGAGQCMYCVALRLEREKDHAVAKRAQLFYENRRRIAVKYVNVDRVFEFDPHGEDVQLVRDDRSSMRGRF